MKYCIIILFHHAMQVHPGLAWVILQSSLVILGTWGHVRLSWSPHGVIMGLLGVIFGQHGVIVG